MRVLDLFSGIGGFSLGLERAGFETVAFCEIEEFPRKVLKKHWPDVPIYEDVRNVTAERLRADGIFPDVITGGFPCQDLSVAGNQKGIEAERSGLWSELCRIIGDIRPRYAIVENVTALISGDNGRWFGKVLGDLAEIGYDCEWHCISASELGAHHHRDRVWIICYPQHTGRDASQVRESYQAGNGSDEEGQKSASELEGSSDTEILGNPTSEGLERNSRGFPEGEGLAWSGANNVAYANSIIQPISINGGERKGSGTIAPTGAKSSGGRSGEQNIPSDPNELRGREKQIGKQECENQAESRNDGKKKYVADTISKRQPRQGEYVKPLFAEAIKNWQAINAESGCISGIWAAEPELGRVANGIPDRTHRLKGLGNAVVPQIPELIGRAIMEVENE